MPYEVREKGTNKLMGTYGTRSRATNKKNKLDNDFGGYNYIIQLVKGKNNNKLKIKKA
jgi:hypothetical protein